MRMPSKPISSHRFGIHDSPGKLPDLSHIVYVLHCQAKSPAISPYAYSHAKNRPLHLHHAHHEKKPNAKTSVSPPPKIQHRRHGTADLPSASSQSHPDSLPSPQAAQLQRYGRNIWTYRHTSRYLPAAICAHAACCASCRSCPDALDRAGGRWRLLSRQQIPRKSLLSLSQKQNEARKAEGGKGRHYRRCCGGCRLGCRSHVECDRRRCGRSLCRDSCCRWCCSFVFLRSVGRGLC